MNRIFITLALILVALMPAMANDYATVNPSMIFIEDGSETESTNYEGNAPFEASFHANIECPDGVTVKWLQWKIEDANQSQETIHRETEDFDFTFLKSGSFRISLIVNFSDGYEYSNADDPLTVSISTSMLKMPNAFSPNGDGINDWYQAKSGCQSIVEFKATIYSRWGQKLYTWTDPYTKESGWDGKFNGKDMPDGVYFVQVSAKGADGRKYNIKRDVNLLRGYNEERQSGSDD